MQIVEPAVLKVAAIEALVRKVDVFKSDSAGVEAYDFLALVDVVVNVLDDFLFVGVVVKAKIFAFGNFSVIVENGKRSFFAAIGQTFALLEHGSIIKQERIDFNRQKKRFLLVCFL